MPSFEPSVMRRAREFSLMPVEGEAENPNDIRMIASTCAPVGIRVMGDDGPEQWSEVLEHGADCVDISATKSLLLNHEHDQIIGAVKSVRLDGNTSIVEATILDGAVLPTGVRVCDAVRSGALKGVSIGYAYRMDGDDIEVDRGTRTLRVKKWRMLEVTLTPIPADPGAGVRSFPTLPKEVQMPDSTDIKQTAPTVDVEAVRSEAKSIAALADSLHLRSADYVGLSLADAQGKMLAEVAKRDAAEAGKPKAPVASHIEVGEEAIEKQAKRAVGALLYSTGFRHTDARVADLELADGTKLRDYQTSNDLRGKTLTDIARGTLDSMGVRSGNFDRHQLAEIILGKRDAGNVSANFFTSFVFANLMKKAVSIGYQMGGRSITYEKIVGRNSVPDYKQFAIGALGLGNLQATVENAAFPELDKAEGVYLDRVQMWGGTLSLTEQMVVSDDTGRFFENLRQAGVIAKKTIDRRCYERLLAGPGGSWATPNTTNIGASGLSYSTADGVHAARQNLARGRAALMNKIGQDGNPLGTIASFLLVPPTLETQAQGIMGLAPGQQNTTNLQYEVISSAWLEFAGLTGNSSSTAYLVADPMEATGLVLSTINGIEEPRVEQYDPGAVAAYKWKIYLPFEVGIASHAYTAPGQTSSQTVIPGIQRCVAA